MAAWPLQTPAARIVRDGTKNAKIIDTRFVLRGLRAFAVSHIAAGQDARFRK
jgi:hypothetical protein